jgi:hypothetical protein
MDLGPAEIVSTLVFLVIFVAAVAFWIWALVDAVRVPDDSLYRAGNKVVWVIVIVLLGALGGIIYVLVGRPARPASAA